MHIQLYIHMHIHMYMHMSIHGSSAVPASKENHFFLLGGATGEAVRASAGSDWLLCGSYQ